MERDRHEEQRTVARDQARSVRGDYKLDWAENPGDELGNIIQRIFTRKPYLRTKLVGKGRMPENLEPMRQLVMGEQAGEHGKALKSSDSNPGGE